MRENIDQICEFSEVIERFCLLNFSITQLGAMGSVLVMVGLFLGCVIVSVCHRWQYNLSHIWCFILKKLIRAIFSENNSFNKTWTHRSFLKNILSAFGTKNKDIAHFVPLNLGVSGQLAQWTLDRFDNLLICKMLDCNGTSP